jgi:metallo-beta-lactamase class B
MRSLLLSTAVAVCAVVVCSFGVPAFADNAAEEQKHVAAATKIAGEDFKNTNLWLCKPTRDQLAHLATLRKEMPPKQVFDNFFYFGTGSQNVWALKTSAGIILWDVHANDDEAKRLIVDAFPKVGLDPKDIKYIIISHGHGDHYGGAQYFQKNYPTAKLIMSKADYYLADTAPARPNWGGPPKHDMEADDGQKITVGDTTVQIFITPGHTPGTLSSLIPVKDKGVTRLFALWGGTTAPAQRDGILTQEESLKRFTKIAEDQKVEGWISNHGLWDDAVLKISKIAANAPSPFLQDAAMRKRYFDVQNECLEAALYRLPAVTN